MDILKEFRSWKRYEKKTGIIGCDMDKENNNKINNRSSKMFRGFCYISVGKNVDSNNCRLWSISRPCKRTDRSWEIIWVIDCAKLESYWPTFLHIAFSNNCFAFIYCKKVYGFEILPKLHTKGLNVISNWKKVGFRC